jgi:hypothetical protein
VARASDDNTGWGAQWLPALTHIDYDNRLPRGHAYANNGAVRDLQITDLAGKSTAIPSWRKRELAESTVGRGEQWIDDLDARQRKVLFEWEEG